MNHRIFILTVLSLTGCGGSGSAGGGAPAVPVTVVIPSTFARDGYIRSSGTVYVDSGLFVGDIDGIIPGVSCRAVVGFDLTGNGIPPGATIQTATLSLEQFAGPGNPYSDLGNMLVDHVNLGVGIDATDYGANTLLAGFGVFSTDAAFVVKSLVVSARVQADLTAGRTFSDFRFRFATDSDTDGSDDHVQFLDTEDVYSLGQDPLLKVTYLP